MLTRRAGTRQAMGFRRMESLEHEYEMMRKFGVGRFGGALALIVDLEPGDVYQPISSPPVHQRAI